MKINRFLYAFIVSSLFDAPTLGARDSTDSYAWLDSYNDMILARITQFFVH